MIRQNCVSTNCIWRFILNNMHVKSWMFHSHLLAKNLIKLLESLGTSTERTTSFILYLLSLSVAIWKSLNHSVKLRVLGKSQKFNREFKCVQFICRSYYTSYLLEERKIKIISKSSIRFLQTKMHFQINSHT